MIDHLAEALRETGIALSPTFVAFTPWTTLEGYIDLLQDICENMVGKTFCPMGEAAVNPVLSTLKRFPDEYDYYIEHKRSLTAH
mgnify:CR=1 FL=1